MRPTDTEVLAELERICRAEVLSPQERDLLSRIVSRALGGETDGLYQKALADELGISSAKQIGVIATRVRAKLVAYNRQLHGPTGVQIELPGRGYEVRFRYRQPAHDLSERAEILVANARAAVDQRTLPGATAALEYLDDALEEHRAQPLLLALKAYCHATRALYGTYPRTDLGAAEEIVRTMQGATVRPWESWFAQACVQMALHWDWAGAAASFEQAILLSGGEARYQAWYTAFLACQGRAAEAVTLQRAAVTRFHNSPIVRADLAATQIYAGRFDEAEETIRTAFTLFGTRTHYLLYVHLAILQEARGDSAAAVTTLVEMPLRWPRTTVTLGLRALFSGLSGDRRTARRHFRKLRAARRIAGGFVPAGQLCIAALGAGDLDVAMTWFRQGAIVERDPNFVLTNAYPFFRHLYDYPEFREVVVGTMNLALPV